MDRPDQLFRAHYGRMVSILTNYFGLDHLDLAEDIVQDTLVEAIEKWPLKGVPNNPEGWLMDVAKKKAINLLKRRQLFNLKIGPGIRATLQDRLLLDTVRTEEQDSMLAMIFLCCHPSLSSPAQITLALKTLCGLSVMEIADALRTKKVNVEKRLYRTRQKFRDESISLGLPEKAFESERLEDVCNTLLVLFNSGYYAPRKQGLINFDFCFEAIRLLRQVISRFPDSASANALLALLLFTTARHQSWTRQGDGFARLVDQDRSLWDRALIAEGFKYLHDATRDGRLNRFQLMAGIAAEHCMAKSFASTNWESILDHYVILAKLDHSVAVQFNHCIAKFFSGKKQLALKELLHLRNTSNLTSDPLYFTTLGVFHQELSNHEKSHEAFIQAMQLSRSAEEKELIQNRMCN